MTMLTEKRHTGGFLLNVEEGHRSIDNGTLITGQNLVAGTVLGQITTGKKWTAYDPNAGDGSQVAKGILYASTDATSADVVCAIVVRDCEVNGDELIKVSVSPAIVDATMDADLAAAHIIVRR